MTNEQILTKAIEKATNGGYHYPYKEISYGDLHGDILEVIFSHDFAKAFWGEGEWTENPDDEGRYKRGWKYYLQQMVLKENPIKYLEKFI